MRDQDTADRLFKSFASGFMLKLLIVLVVFPIVARIIMLMWSLPAVLLDGFLPVDATWRSPVVNGLGVIGFVLAIGGAFLASRELWPKPRRS